MLLLLGVGGGGATGLLNKGGPGEQQASWLTISCGISTGTG